MKLDHLYSLRKEFTIIGLTGRTGSGCTQIAEILSGNFENLRLNGLRNVSDFTDPVFARKYEICRQYFEYEDNWAAFDLIKYVNVLIFFILNKYGGDAKSIKEMFDTFFKEERNEKNSLPVIRLMKNINIIDKKYRDLIREIKSIDEIRKMRSEDELLKLNDLFFGEQFKKLVAEMLNALEKEGYYRTRVLLHWVSCNIRATGDPLKKEAENVDYIYSIADSINHLIKARRFYNKKLNKCTKIVIDSLRNSLEIMFFKQRFSAFYMVATKDVLSKARERIQSRLSTKIDDSNERKRVVDALIKLDEVEYRTKDFSKGIFSSPDVENCIQKSDFHLINLKKDEIDLFSPPSLNAFLTREEQLMKLIALINHPGLITPSSAERAMQIANTAKLNSGCISRQVGAVITDSSYFIKSIGWNDVAKGHTPCNLRNFKDFFDEGNLNDSPHYSDFEKGKSSPNASFKYKGENPGNFKDALIDYVKEAYDSKKNDLNGRNCSFCFKTIHNHYEGEANQVHTRSLHAEENAMLQTTKLGGTGAVGGFLFTTASPCELCSKKAYQLGIVRIYYIDPYPGIAVDQILKGGQNRPEMMPFSGAIGNAYDWLYESLLSYKDEMTMVLELKPKSNLSKEFKNLLQSTDNQELKDFAKKDLQDSEIKAMLLNALGSEIKNNH
jgi:dCMP deaminase